MTMRILMKYDEYRTHADGADYDGDDVGADEV